MQCYGWSDSVALLSMVPGKEKIKKRKRRGGENGTKRRKTEKIQSPAVRPGTGSSGIDYT